MDLGLAGKTAVVTGASKGIGLAVVRAHVGGAVGLAPEEIQKRAAGDSVTPERATPVVMAARDKIGNVTVADFVIDGGLVGAL
jgi:hypothetical protein